MPKSNICSISFAFYLQKNNDRLKLISFSLEKHKNDRNFIKARKIDYLAIYFMYAGTICWTQNENQLCCHIYENIKLSHLSNQCLAEI